MTYELWDQATGNRIEGFEGSEEAPRLAEVVRQIAELQGMEAVDDLFVEVWAAPGDAEPVEILHGDELRRFVRPLVTTYDLEVAGLPLVPTKTRSQAALALAV